MTSNQTKHLRKGNYYTIVNRSNNLALSMPQTKKYSKDKPQFCPIDPSNNLQLWMIEEVQNQRYQIVHAISTLVIECISGNNVCKLQFGKQKANQLFYLEPCNELLVHKFEAINGGEGKVEQENKMKLEEDMIAGNKKQIEENQSIKKRQNTGSSRVRNQKLHNIHTNINLNPHKKVSLKFRLKDRQNSLKYLFCDKSKGYCSLKFMQLDSSVLDTYMSSVWEFVPVKDVQNQLLSSLCFIGSYRSGYVLDVPQASDKPGTKIIQYPCNFRFNQRWIFKKVEEVNGYSYYQIMNAKSGHFLDIKGQSVKQGTQVIQWTETGGKNQYWRLQQQGKRVFLIRSALDFTLLLGVKDNSLKEAAEIVTTKVQTESFWVIHGNIPQ